MKFSELPQDVQERLTKERSELYRIWHRNTAYHVCFTNKAGTRYIWAKRDNGFHRWSKCAGVNEWRIKYGPIVCKHSKAKNPVGEIEDKYEWAMGVQYASITVDGERIDIPRFVNAKTELMDIVKRIGFFEL